MIKADKSKRVLNPPGWPLLAAGLVAGLVSTLLTLLTLPSLPSSADTATAVGLAWLIGVALGGWLGLVAFRALSAGFRLIYKRQRTRVLTAVSRLESRFVALQDLLGKEGVAMHSSNGHPRPANADSPIFSKLLWPLWSFSWGAYPLGIIGIFAYGLVIALYYVGGMDISLHLVLLVAGATVAVLALLFAGLFPIVLNWTILNDCRTALREIDRIEQRLADARAERIAISILDLSIVEAAMTEPPKWLTRLAA